MQRYTVAVLVADSSVNPLTLAIPFDPNAFVSAFVHELYSRSRKNGIRVNPKTHTLTLRLASENGALIDPGDVMGDVVAKPFDEQLYAVFSPSASVETPAAPQGGDHVAVRFLTPELSSKGKSAVDPVAIPTTHSIQQLHELAARQLAIPAVFEDTSTLDSECNCTLARIITDNSALPPNHLHVIHGKSAVDRLEIDSASPDAINSSLHSKFGLNISIGRKKITYHGGQLRSGSYDTLPIISICSLARHRPAHARTEEVERSGHKYRLVDLHTSEQPIHPTTMHVKIGEARLQDLAVDGVLDIFVVNRFTTGAPSNVLGKSAIFRAHSHWQPAVPQTDRGVAMFLSSLRVFASLVSDQGTDRRMKDAVLHVLDLMLGFPPAIRALLLLIDGKTPSSAESAAISHAVYEALHGIIIPSGVVGDNKARIFEGARLLFGFVLEKARTLKLPEFKTSEDELPYLSSFEDINIKDFKTGEPIMHMIRTTSGPMERDLHTAFSGNGVLFNSHTHLHLAMSETLPVTLRVALLAAGSRPEVLVFCSERLRASYQYADGGNRDQAIDMSEMEDLSHLAELAARQQMAVHRPNQLKSAVSPCLTFDRNAHVGVYTGQQPCSDPGQSSLVFRPTHGEATINATVVEQLIAPIIRSYRNEGSAVFDVSGGAFTRRLQAPDELIFFCVDTSASMRSATDFVEVNQDDRLETEELTAAALVEQGHYNSCRFEDTKEYLTKLESFLDMLAIVHASGSTGKRHSASWVLSHLRTLVGHEIVYKHEEIEKHRENGQVHWMTRRVILDLETELKQLKSHWAGLQTHEISLADFLIYRASATPSLGKKWRWILGYELPANAPPDQIPSLPETVTEVPNNFRCPISHDLLEDAAKATDGFTYSRRAIEKWFQIRKSSPMTGLPLEDTTLNFDDEISSAVTDWIKGTDLKLSVPPAKQPPLAPPSVLEHMKITFLTSRGKFERSITSEATVYDLYRLAFRGMQATSIVFQLVMDESTTLNPSNDAAGSMGVRNGKQIVVRIADDADMATGGSTRATKKSPQSHDHAMVKVYQDSDMLFSFWVKRGIPQTFASIIWKYWRHQWDRESWRGVHDNIGDPVVWTDIRSDGDGMRLGWPKKHTESLTPRLSRPYCHGKLGEELLCSEDRVWTENEDRPLVLKVDIHSRSPKVSPNDSKLSRLDVLKQMFEAFINRLISYGYKTNCGLVTFATEAQIRTPLTHVIENFRRATTSMESDGDTALWDAISLAQDQLNAYAEAKPDCRKRIVVFSDGKDSNSKSSVPHNLAVTLRQDKIVMDSVTLGDHSDGDLRTLSYLVGGYRFHPTSLANALSIVEMEPFLSATERPNSSFNLPPGVSPNATAKYQFLAAKSRATRTIVTPDRFPARAEHENIHDEFIAISAASKRPGNPASTGTRSNFRITRLMSEMQTISRTAEDRTYDIYVSERDMSFWKIVLDGPEGTPYSDGTFLLYLHATESYPTFPPEVRFITQLHHPNVNSHGRVCHALLSRDWTSDTTMTTILDTVYGLLLQAEPSDLISVTQTLGYHHDQVEYGDEVREYVRKHASKRRAQWKRDLLGGEDDDDA